ncbi:hypothetical protein [Streptomyces toxytricini]|uniref:Uncharacterized protein n=1 Tax=Streptomyces toxytricini TaxID=67369 RepID=A0ABW8EV75_STRT5
MGPAREHAHPEPDRHRVAEPQPELQSKPPARHHTDARHHAAAVAGSLLGHAQPRAGAVAEP